MLLHPSPNCSLRAESLVHVHFKEEIGIAELIPLVTTYIILFAYIYFSTRRSMAGNVSMSPTSLPLEGLGVEMWKCLVVTKASLGGSGGSRAPLTSRGKMLPRLGFPKSMSSARD